MNSISQTIRIGTEDLTSKTSDSKVQSRTLSYAAQPHVTKAHVKPSIAAARKLLRSARAEANALVDRQIALSKKEELKLAEAARVEGSLKAFRSLIDLEASTQDSLKQIKGTVVELAVIIAQEILEREITTDSKFIDSQLSRALETFSSARKLNITIPRQLESKLKFRIRETLKEYSIDNFKIESEENIKSFEIKLSSELGELTFSLGNELESAKKVLKENIDLILPVKKQ